jgi:hypothetical protein
MFNRVIGTFKLDKRLFVEIERSEEATAQAALVVVVISIVTALGNGLGAQLTHRSFFLQFIGSLTWSVIGWIIWSAVSFFIGSILFKGRGSMPGMLRGIGFSYAPQILSIIPCIGELVGWLWSLAAGYVAINQELKLDTIKTILTIIAGFCLYVLGHAVVNTILGGFYWFLSPI